MEKVNWLLSLKKGDQVLDKSGNVLRVLEVFISDQFLYKHGYLSRAANKLTELANQLQHRNSEQNNLRLIPKRLLSESDIILNCHALVSTNNHKTSSKEFRGSDVKRLTGNLAESIRKVLV